MEAAAEMSWPMTSPMATPTTPSGSASTSYQSPPTCEPSLDAR